MSHEHILLVEDEHDIQELLKFHIEKDGFSAEVANTGEMALELIQARKPDLVLLDLMLPGISGVEVCRTLKSNPQTRGVPVIMLTAKDSENDIIAGLEMGASDYITKPFSPGVLTARIHAVLRRTEDPGDSNDIGPPIRIGALTIDPERHKVEIRSKEIPLTCTEFRILYLLAASPGRAFTRQQIVDQVRGESYSVTERIVDVQMVSLRKKMGSLSDWIETVRGIGYRFKEI